MKSTETTQHQQPTNNPRSVSPPTDLRFPSPPTNSIPPNEHVNQQRQPFWTINRELMQVDEPTESQNEGSAYQTQLYAEDDDVEFRGDEAFWENDDNVDDIFIEEDRHNVKKGRENIDDWGENETKVSEKDVVLSNCKYDDRDQGFTFESDEDMPFVWLWNL